MHMKRETLSNKNSVDINIIFEEFNVVKLVLNDFRCSRHNVEQPNSNLKVLTSRLSIGTTCPNIQRVYGTNESVKNKTLPTVLRRNLQIYSTQRVTVH